MNSVISFTGKQFRGYLKSSKAQFIVQRKWLTQLFSLLCLPLFFWGEASGEVDRLKAISLYSENCALCHGEKLEGGLGGTLLGRLDFVKSDADYVRWIKEGNIELGMPPYQYQLSEEEIHAIVAYIKEMRVQAKDSKVE